VTGHGLYLDYRFTGECAALDSLLVRSKSGPGRCLQHQTGTYTSNLTQTGVVHD